MTTRLGIYRRRRYQLAIRAVPNFDTVEEFSVVVYYRADQFGETVQIARIDTNHGFAHFDRLYHREQPKDPLDADVWEAAALLERNWRRYGASYDRVHGR